MRARVQDPALLAVRQAWIGLPHLEVELVDDTATQASAHAMLVRYKDYVDNHGTAIAVMSAHGRVRSPASDRTASALHGLT